MKRSNILKGGNKADLDGNKTVETAATKKQKQKELAVRCFHNLEVESEDPEAFATLETIREHKSPADVELELASAELVEAIESATQKASSNTSPAITEMTSDALLTEMPVVKDDGMLSSTVPEITHEAVSEEKGHKAATDNKKTIKRTLAKKQKQKEFTVLDKIRRPKHAADGELKTASTALETAIATTTKKESPNASETIAETSLDKVNEKERAETKKPRQKAFTILDKIRKPKHVSDGELKTASTALETAIATTTKKESANTPATTAETTLDKVNKKERARAKKLRQKALVEVKRIAKAEERQEKVIAKKQAIIQKVQAKGDSESIAQAQSEEQEALAVLDKIRETKRAAEAELQKVSADLGVAIAMATSDTSLLAVETAHGDVDGVEGESLSEYESALQLLWDLFSLWETELLLGPAEMGGQAAWLQDLLKGRNYQELYPVNAPYAYVVIEGTTPPKYSVFEVGLTKGEAELMKEIKTYLYETLDIGFVGLQDPKQFLSQKVDEIIKEIFDLPVESPFPSNDSKVVSLPSLVSNGSRVFSLPSRIGSKISKKLDKLVNVTDKSSDGFTVGDYVDPESINKIMYYINRDFANYGKLDPLMRDKMAEDLSADGPDIPLYVFHRTYGSIETNVLFGKEELDSLIYRLSQRSGRHISMAKPLLDASLPTKDRLQLSLGSEVTTRGSTFTIRKFREVPFTPVSLIEYGTFSTEMITYLWMAIENGANILIAGGTASGKTTLLNAIAMFIPPESKIVSIEDTREINLLHQNWIPAVTRQVEEGGNSIEMYDLLRTALRQRPEYVLVGEVRGVEAHTLFQAMATGHITMSTMHADSADTVVKRLTKNPINVPLMLLDSLDIIITQKQVKIGNKGVRRCTKLIEVTGIDFEDEKLETSDLFRWRPDEFEFTGESKVFAKLMEFGSVSEDDLIMEFARRRRILESMKLRGMTNFESLNKVLHDYSIDPEETERWVVVRG